MKAIEAAVSARTWRYAEALYALTNERGACPYLLKIAIGWDVSEGRALLQFCSPCRAY